MNPPQQPENPPPVKAKVFGADPYARSLQAANDKTEGVRDQGSGIGNPNTRTASRSLIPDPRSLRWQTAILAAFLLGLVALATWGFLSRGGSGSAPVADMLPEDPVALINSSTPIPERASPLTIKDTVDDVAYAPESEGWSQAIREAHRTQDEGRYSSAISQYSGLVGSSNVKEAHNALWGLASAYADAGYDELAIRAYSLFTYLRDDPRAARAYFKIGQLEDKDLRWYDAIQSYDEYTRHGGPASYAVMLLRARLLGNTPDSEEIYKQVLASNPQDADLREALLGLAQVDHALERSDEPLLDEHTVPFMSYNRIATETLKLYDRLAAEQQKRPRPILDHAGDPPQLLAAQELEAIGDNNGASRRLLAYTNGTQDYPYGHYSALTELIRLDPTAVMSGTVVPMAAARIAYDAGYYAQAIGFMDILRTLSVDPVERAQAAFLTGKAYQARGDAPDAYNWYTATIQTYPNSPDAPQAIRRAGDMLVEQANWDAAQGTYRQAIEQYPDAADTATTRVNAALLAYRLGQSDVASDLLHPLESRNELSPTLKAQVAFWTGKVEKSQGNAAWKTSVNKVSAFTPGSYLDFRARSLVNGEPDGGPIASTFTQSGVLTASLGIQYGNEAQGRRELLDWASRLTNTILPTLRSATGTLDTEKMEPRLARDPEVARAVALLRLGYGREAYIAVRALDERLRDAGDAVGLAQFAIYLRYNADAQTAMRAAETLAAMDDSNNSDPLKRPKLLLKTLYPTPYSRLVLDEASKRQLDPLAIYALIRQESEFVPDALSGADARGLTQVIPSTGEGIAQQLGDADFSASNLYLPYISIEYGTYYLASNLPQFDRKLLPTLAAYNGGPGNAARWMAGSALFDPDLYVERIDLFETGDYLQRVYTNYGFYRLLYAR